MQAFGHIDTQFNTLAQRAPAALVGPELFASLGIPTPKVVAQLGLATPGLSSSADAPGDNSGIFPWIGPKVLDDLSWNMSRVLTGHATHLQVVGALLFVLDLGQCEASFPR